VFLLSTKIKASDRKPNHMEVGDSVASGARERR